MGRWSRWEYLREMYARYRVAPRKERSPLLTEFCSRISWCSSALPAMSPAAGSDQNLAGEAAEEDAG